jgi:hypothetical protein
MVIGVDVAYTGGWWEKHSSLAVQLIELAGEPVDLDRRPSPNPVSYSKPATTDAWEAPLI